MDTPDEVMGEITSLKDFFIAATKSLSEGNMTSMKGMDVRVTKVCKAAQNAPTEKQKEYLPELNLLIGFLNEYETALREYQATKMSEAAEIVSNDDKP